MDATTGQILTAGNPDAERNPASLTKLMTGYVVDRAVDHRTSRRRASALRPTRLNTSCISGSANRPRPEKVRSASYVTSEPSPSAATVRSRNL